MDPRVPEDAPETTQLFCQFIGSPDRESYLAVRSAIVSSADYEPYSCEIVRAFALIDAGELERARGVLREAMPSLVLCPRAHLALAFIARESNDEEAHRMEVLIAATCCEGILATGDGTEDAPYVVVRTSDEHDVVKYLGKELSRQSLVSHADRVLDLMDCADGSQLYFDITDAYKTLERG